MMKTSQESAISLLQQQFKAAISQTQGQAQKPAATPSKASSSGGGSGTFSTTPQRHSVPPSVSPAKPQPVQPTAFPFSSMMQSRAVEDENWVISRCSLRNPGAHPIVNPSNTPIPPARFVPPPPRPAAAPLRTSTFPPAAASIANTRSPATASSTPASNSYPSVLPGSSASMPFAVPTVPSGIPPLLGFWSFDRQQRLKKVLEEMRAKAKANGNKAPDKRHSSAAVKHNVTHRRRGARRRMGWRPAKTPAASPFVLQRQVMRPLPECTPTMVTTSSNAAEAVTTSGAFPNAAATAGPGRPKRAASFRIMPHAYETLHRGYARVDLASLSAMRTASAATAAAPSTAEPQSNPLPPNFTPDEVASMRALLRILMEPTASAASAAAAGSSVFPSVSSSSSNAFAPMASLPVQPLSGSSSAKSGHKNSTTHHLEQQRQSDAVVRTVLDTFSPVEMKRSHNSTSSSANRRGHASSPKTQNEQEEEEMESESGGEEEEEEAAENDEYMGNGNRANGGAVDRSSDFANVD